MPKSCLGILHICNFGILLRKIVIYLVGQKLYLLFYLFLLLQFTEVTSQESTYSENTVIDILKISHLILNRIGTIQ